MRTGSDSSSQHRGSVVDRYVLVIVASLAAGAIYLGFTRAEALLLDLGRLAGCL